MIGVFSYDVARWVKLGTYTPCLTGLAVKQVIGRTSSNQWGPASLWGNHHQNPCNLPNPPEGAIIVRQACDCQVASDSTYWFCADNGEFYVPILGVAPDSWESTTLDADDWLHANYYDFSDDFWDWPLDQKLAYIKHLNGYDAPEEMTQAGSEPSPAPTPAPAPKPQIKQPTYKWVLKNGVVTIPTADESLITSPNHCKKTTMVFNSYADMLASLNASTTGL